MSNHNRTAAWLSACGKEPGNPQHISVQIGCHLEEIVEQLENLRLSEIDDFFVILHCAMVDLLEVATAIKSGKITAHVPQHHRANFLKELCDGEITGNGVAYLLGMDKPAADAAVLDSNDAKLPPVILPGGKIGKPAGWTPPDMKGFV